MLVENKPRALLPASKVGVASTALWFVPLGR